MSDMIAEAGIISRVLMFFRIELVFLLRGIVMLFKSTIKLKEKKELETIIIDSFNPIFRIDKNYFIRDILKSINEGIDIELRVALDSEELVIENLHKCINALISTKIYKLEILEKSIENIIGDIESIFDLYHKQGLQKKWKKINDPVPINNFVDSYNETIKELNNFWKRNHGIDKRFNITAFCGKLKEWANQDD